MKRCKQSALVAARKGKKEDTPETAKLFSLLLLSTHPPSTVQVVQNRSPHIGVGTKEAQGVDQGAAVGEPLESIEGLRG